MRQKIQSHFFKFSLHFSVTKSQENYRQIYWRNLSTGTPPKFLSAILCFVALVYNYIFIRTAVLRKLFYIRFSYKHCNFLQVCLLVKMASKTVRGSICKINFSSLMFFGVTRSFCVDSTAERSSLACWQTDKVLFLFSNARTEKTTERPCEFKDCKFDKLT